MAGLSALPVTAALAGDAAAKNRFCVFLKFLNELGYEEVAERVAELGFSGVEVPVRSHEGYITPAEAAKELPKFQQALAKRGLSVSIVTTDVLDAQQQYADAVLRAAADAGARFYRLGFYRYEPNRPIVEQIGELRPKFDALADLDRAIGITGLYQNHSGPEFFGGTIWDLYYLLKDHDPNELACVYDVRHAAVEAGESWPMLYSVMKPHIRAYSVKDFSWGETRSEHVPLGEGRVDPEFYKRLAESDFAGPVSLHVEHVKQATPQSQLAAVKRDFAVLRKWMGE